jgi:hypothetical protein
LTLSPILSGRLITGASDLEFNRHDNHLPFLPAQLVSGAKSIHIRIGDLDVCDSDRMRTNAGTFKSTARWDITASTDRNTGHAPDNDGDQGAIAERGAKHAPHACNLFHYRPSKSPRDNDVRHNICDGDSP